MPVIPTCGRQKQGDPESEVDLGLHNETLSKNEREREKKKTW